MYINTVGELRVAYLCPFLDQKDSTHRFNGCPSRWTWVRRLSHWLAISICSGPVHPLGTDQSISHPLLTPSHHVLLRQKGTAERELCNSMTEQLVQFFAARRSSCRQSVLKTFTRPHTSTTNRLLTPERRHSLLRRLSDVSTAIQKRTRVNCLQYSDDV